MKLLMLSLSKDEGRDPTTAVEFQLLHRQRLDQFLIEDSKNLR
jgi:hypothetical protein